MRIAETPRAILRRIAKGESLVVRGNPGSGKTSLLLAALGEALDGASGAWSPVMVLTPDRRRAQDFENRAGAAQLGSVSAAGGHRLVRSVNSFAYLVVSQWLVERKESLPRPKLFGGADEDAWFTKYLSDHADQWAAHLSSAVVESPVLRMDLRNLIARVGQAGLTAEQMQQVAQRAGVPLWELAAGAFADYAGAGDRAYAPTTERLDSARIQMIAARTLRDWESQSRAEGILAQRPVPDLVLVDDIQDCTPPTLTLLRELARVGATIVATSCEESATAAFRGGEATLGSQLAADLDIPHVDLPGLWRGPKGATELARAVTRWVDPRAATAERDPADARHRQGVSVTSGDGRRGAFIADMLRSYHYLDSIPWDRQAVIVRAAGEIDSIRRALRRRGVPLAPGHRALQLSRIPECAALLRLLYSETESESDDAFELVTSPLVNLDRLDLYRFLRAAREERTLQQWLESPEDLPDSDLGRALRTGARLWGLRKSAAAKPAQQGLWMLWEAGGLADAWRRSALHGGWEGEKADERLDAVMALFRRADLWEQQARAVGADAPRSGREFAKTLVNEAVVSDSIADTGLRPPGVEVLTVAQAAGKEWDAVFVTGLQDGGWPVASPPGGLLEIPRLAGILQAVTRTGFAEVMADTGALAPLDPATYRRERRIEEARLLVNAATRARRHLHLVAVENDDQVVSPFLGYLVSQGAVQPFRDGEGRALLSEAPRGLDLPSFIGGLRFATIDPEASDEARTNAARTLAALAGVGIATADPQNWIGAGDLTTSDPPLLAQELRMGPSQLETASQCMLRWFLSSASGEDQPALLQRELLTAIQIGDLVHRVAEEHPHGDLEELQTALDEAWAQAELDRDNWWVQRQKADLDGMIQTLAAYFARSEGPVKIEMPIKMEVAEATVSGRIDRIEELPDGSVRIVDIKTGKSAPSQASMTDHLQLAAYQLALRKQVRVAEASLLMVRRPLKGALRTQDPLTEQQAEDLERSMARLAVRMVGPDYLPSKNSVCETCAFHGVCPAQDKGRRGIE